MLLQMIDWLYVVLCAAPLVYAIVKSSKEDPKKKNAKRKFEIGENEEPTYRKETYEAVSILYH